MEFKTWIEEDLMGKAFRMMNTVGSKPSVLTDFKPGTRVIIKNEDYRGEEAIVTGSTTNMFGKTLILVNLIKGSSRDLCFYPGELTIKRHLN